MIKITNKILFFTLLISSAYSLNCQTNEVWTEKEVALRTTMRELWMDHVVWTREYIVATLFNLPADYKKTTADRLFKNQEDIGNAIIPYYGRQAGTQLTKLLKDHITIGTEVI